MTTSGSLPGFTGTYVSLGYTDSGFGSPLAYFVTLVYTTLPAQSASGPLSATKQAPLLGDSIYGGVYPSMVRVALMKVCTTVSPTYISVVNDTIGLPPPGSSFGFTTHSGEQLYG